MTNHEKQNLKLLGELLVQIRGIAGDAVSAGHVSAIGRNQFTPESACKAVYLLADAAHNIPENLTRGDPASLLYGVEATLRAGVTVFGDRSTFPAFVPGVPSENDSEMPNDESDLREFLDATETAIAALTRIYKRAEIIEDGKSMSTALVVQDLLQNSNRVFAQIVNGQIK